MILSIFPAMGVIPAMFMPVNTEIKEVHNESRG